MTWEMMADISEGALVIVLFIRSCVQNNQIDSMRQDIRTMNRIIKILQYQNGQRADGIDKANRW